MTQAGIGNKRRSMFDSDDDDSNDGNTDASIHVATTQDLVATAATADVSSNNVLEDLSPAKKMKLIDMEKDNLVNSQNCEELLSSEIKALPLRNPRRSTRNQHTNKTNEKTNVTKSKGNTGTKDKVRNSKKVDKSAAPPNKSNPNQCSISMTKGKSKRGGIRQSAIDSNIASESIASKAVLPETSDICDLSNSDSEDSVSELSKPASSASKTKLSSSIKKNTVREAAKISNRFSVNSSSGATSTSSADAPKKCNTAQAISSSSTINTAESTPLHNKQEPAQLNTNTSTGNAMKTSEESSNSVSESGSSNVVPCEEAPIVLTAAQRARIEQNRQRALLIRQERMNKVLPPMKKSEQLEKEGKKVLRINDTKLVDTGAGFFLEEDDGFDNIPEADIIAALRRAEEPAPLFPEDRPRCVDCGHIFDSSYLFKHFDHPACDDCRDNESRHALITKTDARNEYLLQDVDLEKREPPLRYIVRKNPHNDRWGDMKLYLKLQIEERCLEVWGSEEALEEAIAKKAQQRETSKQKKFKKKMLELRMNVRSSLYTRASKSHEHEYGEEEYHEDDDEYSRTCATCGHSYRYDKM